MAEKYIKKIIKYACISVYIAYFAHFSTWLIDILSLLRLSLKPYKVMKAYSQHRFLYNIYAYSTLQLLRNLCSYRNQLT